MAEALASLAGRSPSERRARRREALAPLSSGAGAPQERSGLQARVAANIALHNFCLWVKEPLGRPRLAFTDLVDW